MNLKRILSRSARGKLMDSLSFLPDTLYIQLFCLATTGRIANLKNPTLFFEKQQWLKLHDQHPEYGELVDKLAVRKHIDASLGEGHCFPLLGKWKSFDEVDFDSLPNSFVLKCNHDSGSTKIVRDKTKLTEEDKAAFKKHFERRLKIDYFFRGREYPYKGIEPYLIAEKLMTDEANPGKDIEDFKFYCFNGEPKIMLVVTDRSTDCRFDFFDMEFNHLDITKNHPQADKAIEKPALFEELKQTAAKLSQGMRFVRVDLYAIDNKIYFGEYTFFAGGGFTLFHPLEWEKRLGDWIDIES